MAYTAYSKNIETLCVVAVKLNQTNVHSPSHTTWGVVTCDICGEQFAIGPSRMQGPKISAEECAKRLEALLNEDHKKNRPHADWYEIPD
jgi:hypothetical protein